MKIKLDHLIFALDTLTPLAKAVPPPAGGPLEGSMEALGRILRYTKEVKYNREAAKELAQDAISWTKVITETLNTLKVNAASISGLETQVENMRRILARIADAMDQQTRQGWGKSLVNKVKDADEMARFRQDLCIAYEQFMTQSQMRLQAGQQHLQQTVDHVSTQVEANRQGMQTLLSATEREILERLKPVGAARWDSGVSPTGCLPETRVDLLQTLLKWCHVASLGLSVYWLTGLAGTGKSTIAKTFCEQVIETCQFPYLITFFASRTAVERRDPSRMLFTLVYDLAMGCAALRPHVIEALCTHPDVRDRTRQEQIQRLLIQPIAAARFFTKEAPLVVVIDALDESFGTHGTQGANFIHQFATALTDVPVKLFVTSRPETVLVRTLTQLSEHIFKLHEIEQAEIASDVTQILVQGFGKILTKRSDRIETRPWPKQEEIDALVTLTGHMIVYATTVLKYVGDSRYFPGERLDQVLSSKDPTHNLSAFSAVDSLYLEILCASAQDDDGNIDLGLCSFLRNMIGTLCVLKEHLGIASLALLLNVSVKKMLSHIQPLSSVLVYPDGESDTSGTRTVHIFHESFRDYMTGRCSDARFKVENTDHYAEVALQCMKVLNDTLRQDMCEIQNYTLANDDVHNPDLAKRIQMHIPEILQYACIHWLSHIQEITQPTTTLFDELDSFTTFHLLHWIELLSLLEQLPHAISSLPQLLIWLQKHMLSDPSDSNSRNNRPDVIYQLLSQTLQALRLCEPMLRTHALHTYHNLQLFMPECELLHVLRVPVPSARLLFSIKSMWPASELVMRGHGLSVWALAFSPDGTKLLSGSLDDTVRMWDMKSSRELAFFKFNGHGRRHGWPGGMMSVSFSPDGAQIASCTYDGFACLWDAQGGDLIASIQVVKLDLRACNSLAFFPDGTKLVIACGDGAVRLWDLQSADETAVLVNHTSPVKSLSISPDGTNIASGSTDVLIWDVRMNAVVASLTAEQCDLSESGSIDSVAFSPDGAMLAICGKTNANMIMIWDAQCVCKVAQLQGHSDWVTSITFSSDGTKIVSGSYDCTVRIWDVQSHQDVIRYEGHGQPVLCVIFSPDCATVVSGSDDMTIRTWEANSAHKHHNINDVEQHSKRVTCLAFSFDGTVLASGLQDGTLRLCKYHSGQTLCLLEGHEHAPKCVAFSADGTKVVSGSDDSTVRVWAIPSGRELALFKGHNASIACVKFSADGTQVYSKESSDGSYILQWNIDSPDSYTIHLNATWSTSKSSDMWLGVSGWISSYSAGSSSKELCWVPEYLCGDQFAAHGMIAAIAGSSETVTIIDLSEIW